MKSSTLDKIMPYVYKLLWILFILGMISIFWKGRLA